MRLSKKYSPNPLSTNDLRASLLFIQVDWGRFGTIAVGCALFSVALSKLGQYRG